MIKEFKLLSHISIMLCQFKVIMLIEKTVCVDLTQFCKLLPKQMMCVQPMSTT